MRALPPGLAHLVRVDRRRGCWLWQGRVDESGRGAGYGRVGRAGRAHVLVYTFLVGPVARGLELDHRCHVRRCVNPDHLEPVTHRENMARNRLPFCRRGHPLAGDNAEPSGSRNSSGERTGRTCRTCRRDRRRRARAEGRNA